MKTFFTNAFALPLLALSGSLSAMDLTVSASLNNPHRSYDLEFQNPTSEGVLCKTIEIKLPVGKQGCSEMLGTVIDTWKNLKIKPAGKVADPNYGLEVLSRQKDKGLEFCGNPDFIFNCTTQQ